MVKMWVKLTKTHCTIFDSSIPEQGSYLEHPRQHRKSGGYFCWERISLPNQYLALFIIQRLSIGEVAVLINLKNKNHSFRNRSTLTPDLFHFWHTNTNRGQKIPVAATFEIH